MGTRGRRMESESGLSKAGTELPHLLRGHWTSRKPVPFQAQLAEEDAHVSRKPVPFQAQWAEEDAHVSRKPVPFQAQWAEEDAHVSRKPVPFQAQLAEEDAHVSRKPVPFQAQLAEEDAHVSRRLLQASAPGPSRLALKPPVPDAPKPRGTRKPPVSPRPPKPRRPPRPPRPPPAPAAPPPRLVCFPDVNNDILCYYDVTQPLPGYQSPPAAAADPTRLAFILPSVLIMVIAVVVTALICQRAKWPGREDGGGDNARPAQHQVREDSQPSPARSLPTERNLPGEASSGIFRSSSTGHGDAAPGVPAPYDAGTLMHTQTQGGTCSVPAVDPTLLWFLPQQVFRAEGEGLQVPEEAIRRLKEAESTQSGVLPKEDPSHARSLEQCAVCLGEYEDGELVKWLPDCWHSFHGPCIDSWLHSHSSCPLCRTEVGPALRTLATGAPSHGLDSS